MRDAALTLTLMAAAAYGGAWLAGQSGAALWAAGLWVLARAAYSGPVRAEVRTALERARPLLLRLVLVAVIGVLAYRVSLIGAGRAWQRFRDLTRWQLALGALEVLLTATAIALGVGLLLGLLSRLRRRVERDEVLIALPEAGLIVWLVAAWTTPAPTTAFGAFLGGISLLAARLEGESRGEPRQAPRRMLIALALVGHRELLSECGLALYSLLVGGVMHGLPGELSAWFIAFGLAVIAASLGWLLTRDLVWRAAFMNRRSEAYLAANDADDDYWRSWFAWRHRSHAGRLHRWWASLCVLRRALIGSPKPTRVSEVETRVEVFLTARLAETTVGVERCARAWEALRLRWTPEGRPDPGLVAGGKNLAAALAVEARRLWLVTDYRFCPVQSCGARFRASLDEVKALVLRLDRHLRRRALLDAFGGEGVAVPAPEAGLHSLRTRFLACLALLAHATAGWDGVARIRMALMADDVRQDRERLETAAQLRTWFGNTRPEDGWLFEVLLETHVAAHDWAAVIEECRRWELTGRRLTGSMRRLLGESWFHYAFEIESRTASVLARFALGQAAGELFAARAREALQEALQAAPPAVASRQAADEAGHA